MKATTHDVIERLDGRAKVTGEAAYAADITRPGMLFAKVLRSVVPHARIVRIDAARARELPGVHTILTGADLPPVRVGRSMRDMPVLAQGKVRFVGEKVVAVAAESLDIAQQALDLIDVEYEELPAVYDPIDAMRPGAPLIHDPDEVRAQATPKQRVADYPNSVSAPVWGASETEVQAALDAAPFVFEHTFRTPVQHQGYIEPHSCLVELDDRGVAHIWASNKAPFLLLDYLRLGLGLSREQVEIHMLPLGGDFGGKGSFMDIPLAYFLAKASGRPVKLTMTFAEELMAGNPRHSAVVTVKSGFDRNGKLLARWTRAIYNSGGYAAFKPAPDATLPGIRGGGLGPYPVPVFRVEGHMVYTNTVPCGHMRAPGEAQPIHSVECHMDLCARAMGMDPLELRLINAPDDPRETPTGEPGSRPRAREALQAAARAIGWTKPRPNGVGRGIALVEVGNSLGEYMAAMTVARDGQIVLHTPIIENGAGMLTAFRTMAAEEFGLSLDRIRIEQTTDGIEYDRGVGGSRITRLIGRMIAILSERLQDRLAELVAAEFGYDASQVRREPGGFRTPDGRLLSTADAASLSPSDLDEVLRYTPSQFDVVEVYAAVGVEARVDLETGEVKPLRIVSAHEVGRIVNPVGHQGQIEGGLAQGFGYALCEGLRVEDGRVTTLNLQDYKLPVVIDLPEMETILLPPDPSLGITPIGEGPNCAMSAAIVNAVVDVVGRQVDIPISPEALAGR
ncbi:MAG TPA: xanthine dehydrogenase family protein molybdopterin-binding subunit [Chloroflexota bacterium]|nr:xanthine dehydrogenase family protein molybdopterin-binding subunit [Chloroflexota bacterium]